MQNLNTQKANLRQAVLSQWKQLTLAQRQQMNVQVATALALWPHWQMAGQVLAYAPLPSEIAFLPELMLYFSNKQLAFPRVIGGNMQFFYDQLNQLKLGPRKVLESHSKAQVEVEKIGLALIPALAVSQTGQRLGRGGGFYDKFLQTPHKFWTVSIVPSFAVFEQLPCEPHDQAVDAFLSIAV